MSGLRERIEGGLLPAVPVPFRGSELDAAAQRDYARWMAAQPVAVTLESVTVTPAEPL